MNQLAKRITNLIRGQRGESLIETLVGVGILGAIGVCLLTSLTTGMNAVGIVDEQSTAQHLAQVQLEDTKSHSYIVAPATYPTTVTPPDSYSVSVEAQPLPGAGDDIQKIVVTVSREGRALLIAEDFKVNR